MTGLVGVESTLYPGNTLVTAGSLHDSLLWRKVAEDLTGEGLGGTMPPGSLLAPGELSVIEDWILGGANTTCVVEQQAEVVPLSPEAHLNRVATALMAQRPSAADLAAVQSDPNALDGLIDDYMSTPAFGETVRDLHNDTMLVRTNRLFLLLFPAIGDLANLVTNDPSYADARRISMEAMEAPLRTAEYIVATDRPYTELVTGDYMIGTAATQAIWGDGSLRTTTLYGGFPTTQEQGAAYSHSEDPSGVGAAADFDVYTWVDGRGAAGVISSNSFMSRWQSAGANYGRGRANAITKAFLCYDYLSNPVDVSSEGGIDLADPNAVANAVSDPGTSCWGCHATLDPLAAYTTSFRPVWFSGTVGVDQYPFQMHSDLYAWDGALNMYTASGRVPGYFVATADEPNPTPADPSGDGTIDMTDLGLHIAADPRFVTCTVKRFHSYFTQRELHGIDASTLTELEDVFTMSGYNAKALVKAIMLSDSFAASHTATDVGADDFNGVLRIRPSQAARLYEHATGHGIVFPVDFELNLLDDGAFPGEIPLVYGQVDYFRDDFIGFRELGGGLDSFNVTRPVRTFTGGTGAAYRWIGNFGGFYAVAVEAGATQQNRTLLTAADFLADTDEASVRALLVELHLKLYGLDVDAADATVDDAYDLWSGLYAIHNDASRAWMHVVSAMLQDVRFAAY